MKSDEHAAGEGASMKIAMNVLRCVLLVLSLSAAAQDSITPSSHRFTSKAARFSLVMPDGWSFVSHDGANIRLSEEELKQVDEELRKKVERLALPLPVVMMTRNGASSEGVVSVFVAPLSVKGASPRRILELSFAEAKKIFPDLTLETPMRELEVSGRPAAEYMATYTVRMTDGAIASRGGLIVVPRGEQLFIINLVAVPPDDRQYVDDFAKIVASITIGD